MIPIQINALYGQPVSLVSDGEFVGHNAPLPVTTLPESRLVCVKDAIPQAMTDTDNGFLKLTRIYSTPHLHRFAVQIPSEVGRIEYAQFLFSGYTPLGSVADPEKETWRTMKLEMELQVLETPYKSYTEVVSDPSASRWTFVDCFPLTVEQRDGVVRTDSDPSTYYDAFWIVGGTGPIALPFLGVKSEENYPFRYLVGDIRLRSDSPVAILFVPSGTAVWSVGWTRRALNILDNFVST